MKSYSGLSRIIALLAVALLIGGTSLLAGCGQKGPLYMPGAPGDPFRSTKAAPTSSPAPGTLEAPYVPASAPVPAPISPDTK